MDITPKEYTNLVKQKSKNPHRQKHRPCLYHRRIDLRDRPTHYERLVCRGIESGGRRLRHLLLPGISLRSVHGAESL